MIVCLCKHPQQSTGQSELGAGDLPVTCFNKDLRPCCTQPPTVQASHVVSMHCAESWQASPPERWQVGAPDAVPHFLKHDRPDAVALQPADKVGALPDDVGDRLRPCAVSLTPGPVASRSAGSSASGAHTMTPNSVTQLTMAAKYTTTSRRRCQVGGIGASSGECSVRRWAERTNPLPMNARMNVPIAICRPTAHASTSCQLSGAAHAYSSALQAAQGCHWAGRF